jgi:CRP-like cAMP-binding protein
VEIFVQLSSSPEKIPLSIIKNPYQTFAWSALVPPNYYTASSLCKKDTRIVAIKRDALMQVLENNPEIGMTVYQRIAKVVSERLRNCRGILIKSL